MSTKLIIVESPAKAKTIKKYVGKGFEILASMGHLRDLPKSKIGIDIEDNFNPKYINIKGKGPIIKSLKKAASKSQKVFLATDPDREGEAISWHLAHILNLDHDEPNRITFNEITKVGVKNGMANPRKIDQNLVDAQQARRVLDRLVGYKISPFLWKKVRPGLSAGRVQSVALRLIVDREEEIASFKPKEYWSIEAEFSKNKKKFTAQLFAKNGKKVEIENEAQATALFDEAKDHDFEVVKIKKGSRKRAPFAPFTTSTLQQDASRKLNFSAAKTMQIAQQLYEGVNVKGKGTTGLITYMRTDSVRISAEAAKTAKELIEKKWGSNFLPPSPRVFKTKSKSQDGHEAIRPTNPDLLPDEIQSSVSADQFKLYSLIWKRFIASQMADAVFATCSVQLNCNELNFKASGFTTTFVGFSCLYDNADEVAKNCELPELEQGEILKPTDLIPNQHFTQAPPRFSEASLTKTLEELEIGRPSTYVPTISTIISREYVEREKKQLKPTILGKTINKLMKNHFQNIVDVKFTAKIEEDFDKIAQGELKWKNSIEKFYSEFQKTLTTAEKTMETQNYRIPDEETDELCDKCGKPMVVKRSRFGKFLACSGYPDCKNTKKILITTNGVCPQCGGKIIKKNSSKGRVFFGCANFPNCTFMTWDEPSNKICEKCKNTMFIKKGKNAITYCFICEQQKQPT